MAVVVVFCIFAGIAILTTVYNARATAALQDAIAQALPVAEGLHVETDGFGDFDSDVFPRVHVSGADLPGFARFGPRDHHDFFGGSFRSGDAGFDAEVAVATDDRLLTLAALDASTRSAVEAAVGMGALYDAGGWTHQHRKKVYGPGTGDRNRSAAVSSAQVLMDAATALMAAAKRLEGAELDQCLLENLRRDHDLGYRIACLDTLEGLGSPYASEAQTILRTAEDPQTRLAGLRRSPDPTPAEYEALVLDPGAGSARLEALKRLDALDARAGERAIRHLLDQRPSSMPDDLACVVASRAPSDTPLETAQRWTWHPNEEVRRHIIGLLSSLGGRSVDVLLRIIETANPDVDGASMVHAARALQGVADSTVVRRLRQARPPKRRHRRVQRAIDEAITSLAGDVPRGALSGAEVSGGELSSPETGGDA